jgi:alkylation response protein AidB-like acyl-CoA dehydrogenase
VLAERLMIWHAAWVIDNGGQARQETSMAKTYVSEAVNRVVDRALQITGSHGVSNELPLASFYRNVRPFRIYDGPSEVHRMVIAQRVLREAAARPVAGHAPATPEVAEVTTPIERPKVAATMVD